MISNRKGNKQVNDCTEKSKTYDTITPEIGLPIEPIIINHQMTKAKSKSLLDLNLHSYLDHFTLILPILRFTVKTRLFHAVKRLP